MLNCREIGGVCCARESVKRGASARSDFISANVVAACLEDRVEGLSSFAGGGGGATISGAGSPRGPRGSDSKSKSSNLETIDWPRREPVGRRREVIGDDLVAVVVRGVEVVVDAFCGTGERLDWRDG
jgi:hypothetical protein